MPVSKGFESAAENCVPYAEGDEYEGYHQFGPLDEDGEGHGSFEVFLHQADVAHADADFRAGCTEQPGWYWWACSPGCLPDGDPSGPFATSKEAYDNAMEE